MIKLQAYMLSQIEQSIKVKETILKDKDLMNQIIEVALTAVDVYNRGNKILLAGNGGSAADAQHIAGELVSRFYFDRPGLPAMALTTDTSIITAIGNDYGYEKLFARQIQANGVKGDMLIGFSTSGNSKNIILGVEEANNKGLITVCLTGQNKGSLNELSDFCINVPSNETPRIQESHILIGHIICSIIEESIFGVGFSNENEMIIAR